MPKLKTLEQIFKEKGGFEIVGEVNGADMVGWTYDGPFDELPAQSHPGGYPPEIAEVVLKQNWATRRSAQDVHRVVAWDAVGETEGTGIVHIAPGCGKEDFQLGKEHGLSAGRAARRLRPLPSPASASSTGKSAVDPATTDWILDDLKEKGRPVRRREVIRTAIRTAGAARRSCCSASSMNGSST